MRAGLNAKTPMTLVSEGGLYKLIMRSDKPAAHVFQDWVTCEVLPSIRKDGGYVMGQEKVRAGEMSEDEFIQMAIGLLQRKIERLVAERRRSLLAPDGGATG
jgi:prophage antirepressor-like protein